MASKPARTGEPPQQFDVIVCGSLHLDIVVKAPTLPRIDETAVGTTWQKRCGGKGGNQAVNAAHAGGRTAMIGRVGDDEFGQTLRTNLAQAGVEMSGITIDPINGTGMSVAILQDNGDYGAVIVSGSNLTIDASTIAQQWNALGSASVLVLQNEIPHSANLVIARIAKKAGALVVYNAAPVRVGVDDLLDCVDVLIVNRVEAEAMFGVKVNDRKSARDLLQVRDRTLPAIVITLGGEGLVLAMQSGAIFEFAPIPVEVISTHGAGDCFVGVLAAKLAQGSTVALACEHANLQAAALVSKID
jgi:ribokinase